MRIFRSNFYFLKFFTLLKNCVSLFQCNGSQGAKVLLTLMTLLLNSDLIQLNVQFTLQKKQQTKR